MRATGLSPGFQPISAKIILRRFEWENGVCPGIVGHEAPGPFGHLESLVRGDLCPEGGYRTQPRVSTLIFAHISEERWKLEKPARWCEQNTG